jgi:hypothetical protein
MLEPMRSIFVRSMLAAAVAVLALSAVSGPAPLAAAPPGTPFATWEVPRGDIAKLGSPRTELLVKAFSPTMDPIAYLDEAAGHGQRVIVYFTETVNESTGTVVVSKVGPWVNLVKDHPALWGYLTVKEPSWIGISLAEMRALRSAYTEGYTYLLKFCLVL